MIRERYVAAKQKWAEKEKARGAVALSTPTADRLPPGQHITEGFPVLDLGVQPDVPTGEWSLQIDGLVEHPITLDWDSFNALPQVEDVSDFHCVTTWSKYDCRWGGVAFTTLWELVQPRPEARFVFFTGYDDYGTNVPVESLLDEGVLIATRFDGAPLAREHGGPARVVMPRLYAWKSAKFIKAITFLAENRRGFWEQRGYSDTAAPWTDDRYS